MNKFRNVIKKIVFKILIRLNKYVVYIKNKKDHACMPEFRNKPKNLTINMPRNITNPEKMILGDSVKLGSNCILSAITNYPSSWMRHSQEKHAEQKFDPEIIIGNRVTSTGGLHIASVERITIEDDVMFAANVFVTDFSHGCTNVEQPFKYQGLSKIAPVLIKRGSWIGQNVVILAGVTIGEMSIIGANSVVTKDIPDKSIAVGAPAKVIKYWSQSKDQWLPVKEQLI